MKKVVLIMLSLAIVLGTILAPVAASATTYQDCYDFFCELPQAWEYKEEAKKLMDVVPCDDSQAAVVMEGLEELKTISTHFSGDDSWRKTDPRGYSATDIYAAIAALDKICNALHVTYEIVPKTSATRISDVDDIEVHFFYEGELIYIYDGDAISKTGNDVMVWPAVAGVALLAVAAVLVCTKKSKENA